EMQRIIAQEEPERPSTRLAQASRATAALGAQSIIKNQKSKIDWDLDWIVMKCLEKDRSRRYATANGLAADVHRYLQSEPVVARPRSHVYALRKAIRRNQPAVIAGCVVALALIAGIAVSSWQALRASRERVRAERRLEAAVKFMGRTFNEVSPALSD